jgi:DNA-binding NtrC family response regulator
MAEKARLVRENELLRTRVERLGGYEPVDSAPNARFQGGTTQEGLKLGPASGAACTDLEELERITVQRVFEQVGGDKEQAQKLLGISRATLYRKIKRYGIETRMAAKKAAGE